MHSESVPGLEEGCLHPGPGGGILTMEVSRGARWWGPSRGVMPTFCPTRAFRPTGFGIVRSWAPEKAVSVDIVHRGR